MALDRRVARGALHDIDLFRLLLDRPQREPAREQADVDGALRRRQRAFQGNQYDGTSILAHEILHCV